MRITLSVDGQLLATAFPTDPFLALDPLHPDDNPVLSIILDTTSTQPSLFTSTKTTRRGHYDNARARANLPPFTTPDGRNTDVILYTLSGCLSETSIRNLAVRRGNEWITPNAQASGCLPGVMRRVLLEQGIWKEAGGEVLCKQDLFDGEIVMTANAVEGCRLARVLLSK